MKANLKIFIHLLFLTFNSLIFNVIYPNQNNSDSFRSCNCYDNDICNKSCSCQCYRCGTTIFIPRSQGTNSARELVGWQKQIYRPFLCQNYMALMTTFEYMDSFKANKIAKRLFCTDCLTFAGSQAERIADKDLVADYFGLSSFYKGTLSIKPRIQNYILDFEFYLCSGELSSGLYLILHIPLTYTRWSLGLNECIACQKTQGNSTFKSCYMFSDTPEEIYNGTQCKLLVTNNIISSTKDCTSSSIREALSGNFLFGDMTYKWKFGKYSFVPKSKVAIADLDIILGYNFWQSDYGHLALFLQVVAPTGNRPNGKYIFQPIVGNGKHWELGGGLSTHISLCNDYKNRSVKNFNLGLWIEGNITYIFKNKQIRSFDFIKNGLLSRYMLLKEYDFDGNYIGRMINAINYNTRNCQVHIGYRVDYSAKVVIEYHGWDFDAGYNIYAKNKETVCIDTACPCDIDLRKFGIKGLEGVCCTEYDIANGMIIPTGISQKINNTQDNATMFKVTEPKAVKIPNSDTKVCLAYNNSVINVKEPIDNKTFYLVNTSAKPVFISCKDLDPNSAAQCRMLTHKIFNYLGYTWYNICYEPHFGIGSEVEFDGTNLNSALNQWGFWVKGGLNF